MPFSYTALFIFCATIIFVLGWLGLLPFGGNQKKRYRKWLLANGMPIVANIDRIREDSVGRKKESSWIILASWTNPEDGTTYRFESARLEFDPGVYLESGIIPVIIDPANPERYYMDMSELRMAAGY